MSTKIGIAVSTLNNSYDAGKEMAEEALRKGKLSNPAFSFVFASNEHKPEELLGGVKSALPEEIVIAGGSTMGTISSDKILNDGINAGIMLIESSDIAFKTIFSGDLENGVEESGIATGKVLKEIIKIDNPNLLLFYDSIPSDSKYRYALYQANPIIRGIENEINEWPPTAGVGLVSSNHTNIKAWNENEVQSGKILSLVVSGNVRMDTTIMHGCKPASDYHTITRVKENLVLEIDHKLPTQIVREYMGDPDEIDWKSAMFFITLGFNKGDKYGPFVEENYVNRMVMGVDSNTQALNLIEADLNEGDEFQFMRRSIEPGIVGEKTRMLMDSIGNRKPLFAFYISCGGRMKKMWGSIREEADEVRETLGEIPLLGIYSGVEIARIRGVITPLDWTGVLCLFSQPS